MISKRRVYYVSGFDPRGASFYHRLFREESRKHARLTGADITTQKRQRDSAIVNSWQIKADWGNDSITCDYRFLCWDDLIRAHWAPSLPHLIVRAIPMYGWHLRHGLFKKFRAAGRGPYLSSILPMLYALTCLLISAAAVATVAWMAQSLLGLWPVTVVLAAAAGVALLQQAKKRGEQLNVWWILQTYMFLATWGRKPIPELNERAKAFAALIEQEQHADPVEEIVLVGHCVGSIVAVEIVSELYKLGSQLPKQQLTLVTLGQCIPYVSYAHGADHFRRALSNIACTVDTHWLDMGARADPLCFQQINPAEAEGIPLKPPGQPLKTTVRPYLMYGTAAYNALKKNKLRLHFQYLMSSDLLTAYDYFRLTTGPEPVREQHHD